MKSWSSVHLHRLENSAAIEPHGNTLGTIYAHRHASHDIGAAAGPDIRANILPPNAAVGIDRKMLGKCPPRRSSPRLVEARKSSREEGLGARIVIFYVTGQQQHRSITLMRQGSHLARHSAAICCDGRGNQLTSFGMGVDLVKVFGAAACKALEHKGSQLRGGLRSGRLSLSLSLRCCDVLPGETSRSR